VATNNAAALRWPGITDVRSLVNALEDTANELDETAGAYEYLINADTHEPREGAPHPTVADLGALTTLIASVDLEIFAIKGYRDRLKRIARAAALAPLEGEETD
jgi:hypothetical protein